MTLETTSAYNNDIDAEIQQALEHGDLPSLAALMEQRRYLPLMLAAQRLYAARKTHGIVDTRVGVLGKLAQTWERKQAELQRNIQASGANYLRNQDYQTADIIVRSLAQWRQMLGEKLKHIGRLLHDAEPNLAASLQGATVIMPEEVEAGAEALWQRITDDLARYGVELEKE